MTQSVQKNFFSEQSEQLLAVLRKRGITDERVLRAIGAVPREKFVHPAWKQRAYEDSALPIECKQTISQPFTVAFMTSLLEVRKDDKILEIGTGSGYQAAILHALGARVFTIERHQALHYAAVELFTQLAIPIAARLGDGTIGWSEYAPFAGIIVTAGSPDVPPTLAHQLAIGGKLVIPVGAQNTQTLYKVTRKGDEDFNVEEYNNFQFVPLIGKEGWDPKP